MADLSAGAGEPAGVQLFGDPARTRPVLPAPAAHRTQAASGRPVRRTRTGKRRPRLHQRLHQRLFSAVFGRRNSRRRAVAVLILVAACLLTVGWRGIGPWLAQTRPGLSGPDQAVERTGGAASGQSAGITDQTDPAEQRQPGDGVRAATATGSAQPAPTTDSAQSPARAGSIAAASAGSTAPTITTASAPSAAPAASAPPATATAGASPATTTNSAPKAQPLFPGIADSVTQQWTFPMKSTPDTPSIGLFGASRSNGRLHAGIDLYAPQGTPVYAMTAGRVRHIEVFYQGLMAIEIENRDGTTIRYCELMNTVQIGDRVSQGQLLGRLKRNYDGTCMLHLEIYAAIRSAPLTQIDNQSNYPLLPARFKAKTFRRRSDLVDPGAIYALPKPAEGAGG